MSDELVTVAEFETVYEAEMVKDCLGDNDIKASVVGDDLIAISPAVGKTMVEIKVFVKDAERAKAVLEERKKQCREAVDEQAQGECGCDCDCDSTENCCSDSESDCGSGCDTDCDCDCDCQGDAGEDA